MKFTQHKFLSQNFDHPIYDDLNPLCELYQFGDLYCHCFSDSNNYFYLVIESAAGKIKVFKCNEQLLINKVQLVKMWCHAKNNMFFASFEINSEQYLSFLITNYENCYFFIDNIDDTKTSTFLKSKSPIHASFLYDTWVLCTWNGTQTAKLYSTQIGTPDVVKKLSDCILVSNEDWDIFKTYVLPDQMLQTFFIKNPQYVFIKNIEGLNALSKNIITKTETNTPLSIELLESIINLNCVDDDFVVFANNSTIITKNNTNYKMIHIPYLLRNNDFSSHFNVFIFNKFNLLREIAVMTTNDIKYYTQPFGKLLVDVPEILSYETNVAALKGTITEAINPWLNDIPQIIKFIDNAAQNKTYISKYDVK